MPGSLGIESIFQLFDEYIRSLEPGAHGIQIASGSEFSWKYRGQVLKPHTLMQVEAHFSDPVQDGTGCKVCGDASLWADDVRIYTVNQLCVHYQK